MKSKADERVSGSVNKVLIVSALSAQYALVGCAESRSAQAEKALSVKLASVLTLAR